MNGAFIHLSLTVLLGCLLSPWLNGLPRGAFQAFAAVLLWPIWRSRGSALFLPFFLLGIFCLTVSSWQLDRLWPADSVHFWRSPQRINLEGRVTGSPEVTRQGKKLRVSFVLETEFRVSFEGEEKKKSRVTGRVQVRLYQCGKIPAYGDEVLVSGVLQEPRSQRNPFGFDERRFLAEKGLDSVLKGYGAKSLIVMGPSPERNRILEAVFDLRTRLSRRIESLWEPRAAGYFKALVIGERGEVPPEEKEAFVRTSTAHILSISGLHFTLIAGTFFLFLTALGVRQRAAAFVSVIFLAVYVFLAGASIPVVRSGVMACLVMGALLLERESQAIHLFCFALCAFLLLDSRVLTSVSFQLSFLSVFFLVIFCQSAHPPAMLFSEGVKTSVVVAAGTFPVTSAVFHGFSLSGIPANIAAVPLFNAALLFALLSLIVSPVPLAGPFAAWAAGGLLKAGLSSVAFFSAIPGSYVPVASPSVLKLGAYTFFGALAVVQKISPQGALKKFRRPILAGWLFCGLSFFLPQTKPWAPSFTLFETRAHPLILAEFGAEQKWMFFRMNSRFRQEEAWMLRPYLQGHGIRSLQGAVSLEKASGAKRDAPVGSLAGVSVDSFLQAAPRGSAGEGAALGQGSRVRLKSGSGFQVLGFVKDKALLHFWMGACDILVIPALNAETVSILRRLELLAADSEILLLPGLTENAAQHLESLLGVIDPALVVVPDLKHWPEPLTVKRLLSQKNTGGIRFWLEGSQLFYESHADQKPHRLAPLPGPAI